MEEKKKKQKKKGFTLIELLAVIVVLSIILIMAVPAVTNVINKSKDRAFYASVSNLVDSIKPENVLEDKDYCMYNYSKNETDKTELIKNMYLIAHMEEGKIIYSVYARSKEDKVINIYDFSKTDMTNNNTWSSDDINETAFGYAMSLNIDYSKLSKYKICGIKQ